MTYLGNWRMQIAAGMLSGGATIACVAADVGYESEAAFNRMFKRCTGMSPGAWRKRSTAGSGAQPVIFQLLDQCLLVSAHGR